MDEIQRSPGKSKKRKRINVALRLIVTLVLIGVMYWQLDIRTALLTDWQSRLNDNFRLKWPVLLFAILLLPLNYFLESAKWFLLVNHFERHSFWTAFRGVLTGLTAAMITPARLGDYVGKLMYIRPENNWKGIWANLTNSLAQTLVTLVFGLLGLILLSSELTGRLQLDMNLLLISSVVAVAALFTLYHHLEYLVKGLRFLPDNKWFSRIKGSLQVVLKFNREKLNLVLLFAFARYLVFLGQYVLLLVFWGIGFSWTLPFSIAVIYLIQTLLPFPPILSFFVRGEVALLVLSGYTENGLLILSAALNIWLINLLLPSLLGLFLLYQTDILKTMGLSNLAGNERNDRKKKQSDLKIQ
jgi:hypothetical protein